jgi:SSS family solute:Na+ symporter
MSLSDHIPMDYPFLKSTLHKNMIIVVGTLTIFFTGLMITNLKLIYIKYKNNEAL